MEAMNDLKEKSTGNIKKQCFSQQTQCQLPLKQLMDDEMSATQESVNGPSVEGTTSQHLKAKIKLKWWIGG